MQLSQYSIIQHARRMHHAFQRGELAADSLHEVADVFLTADVGRDNFNGCAVSLRCGEQVVHRFGSRISTCQHELLCSPADQPFGDAAPQHSQSTRYQIGGIAADPQMPGFQFSKGLSDQPRNIALAAGGNGDLRLTVWVQKLSH